MSRFAFVSLLIFLLSACASPSPRPQPTTVSLAPVIRVTMTPVPKPLPTNSGPAVVLNEIGTLDVSAELDPFGSMVQKDKMRPRWFELRNQTDRYQAVVIGRKLRDAEGIVILQEDGGFDRDVWAPKWYVVPPTSSILIQALDEYNGNKYSFNVKRTSDYTRHVIPVNVVDVRLSISQERPSLDSILKHPPSLDLILEHPGTTDIPNVEGLVYLRGYDSGNTHVFSGAFKTNFDLLAGEKRKVSLAEGLRRSDLRPFFWTDPRIVRYEAIIVAMAGSSPDP